MTKLNIDIKDHKFRELLTYWRRVIGERLRRGQYYEDPRYGMLVLTRREFLKLLLSLGIAGAIATLGIGMFNAHWLWAQETTNPPPTPAQYNYGELNWLELTVKGTPLGEGLVAEYLFYEGSGTVLHDTSGNGCDGTIYGGAVWGQLPNGKYYIETNGINAYVDVLASKIDPIFPTYETTIEAVFCPIEPTGEERYTVCRKGDGLGIFYTDSRVAVTAYFAGVGWREPGYLVNPYGKWWHVVGRRISTRLECWVNSELKSYFDVGDAQISIYTGKPFRIGAHPYNMRYTKARIVLVRLFSRALSDTELGLLHKLAKIMVPELP